MWGYQARPSEKKTNFPDSLKVMEDLRCGPKTSIMLLVVDLGALICALTLIRFF